MMTKKKNCKEVESCKDVDKEMIEKYIFLQAFKNWHIWYSKYKRLRCSECERNWDDNGVVVAKAKGFEPCCGECIELKEMK